MTVYEALEVVHNSTKRVQMRRGDMPWCDIHLFSDGGWCLEDRKGVHLYHLKSDDFQARDWEVRAV